MISLYGKCVGITKNSEANNGTTDENCKWKSDNPNFKLATFGSETVGTFSNISTFHCYCKVYDIDIKSLLYHFYYLGWDWSVTEVSFRKRNDGFFCNDRNSKSNKR